jgi:hypothetical protein
MPKLLPKGTTINETALVVIIDTPVSIAAGATEELDLGATNPPGVPSSAAVACINNISGNIDVIVQGARINDLGNILVWVRNLDLTGAHDSAGEYSVAYTKAEP